MADIDLNDLTDRYVAVWNESDKECRHAAVREPWAADGQKADPGGPGHGVGQTPGVQRTTSRCRSGVGALVAMLPGGRRQRPGRCTTSRTSDVDSRNDLADPLEQSAHSSSTSARCVPPTRARTWGFPACFSVIPARPRAMTNVPQCPRPDIGADQGEVTKGAPNRS